MSEPALLPLVASLVDAPLPVSGIAWLDAMRRDNREVFVAGGLPLARVEAWKYTALRGLARRSFADGDAAALTRAVDPSALALPGVEGARLVFVNGVFRADLSALEALPSGLTLQPLSQALHTDPDPLRFVLSRRHYEADEAFTQINAAHARDGVVLRLADHAKIAAPVHLVFVGAPAKAIWAGICAT
jgi:Fe-S cluster assembly protein SufD